MNKKSIINIIIIVVGIIIIATLGFNIDLVYSNHKEIDIYLGTEFENKDIENIVKEVTNNEKVIVNKVELYKDMLSITIKDITDEQLQQVNTKINEKYNIENTLEDLVVTNVPNTRIRDLVKPYITPVMISLIIILAYIYIYVAMYKKQNRTYTLKTIAHAFVKIICIQALYFAIIAIIRLPFGIYTLPISMFLYALTTVVIMHNIEKQFAHKDKENK